MSTTIHDLKGGVSSCCGAPVYLDWEVCSDCKEHCSIESEEDEDRAFSSEQLRMIADQEKACAEAGCDDDGHKCFE